MIQKSLLNGGFFIDYLLASRLSIYSDVSGWKRVFCQINFTETPSVSADFARSLTEVAMGMSMENATVRCCVSRVLITNKSQLSLWTGNEASQRVASDTSILCFPFWTSLHASVFFTSCTAGIPRTS